MARDNRSTAVKSKAQRDDVIPPNRLNCQISNKAAFIRLGEEHPFAGIYFFMMLDKLGCLAHEVTRDFFKRAQLYNKLEPNIAELIARLNAQYGSDPFILSREQRYCIYSMFGYREDGTVNENGDFKQLKYEVQKAANNFANRVYDTSVGTLIENFRQKLIPFQRWLESCLGDSLTWSFGALNKFYNDFCYEILRNPGIVSVFGSNDVFDENWVYQPHDHAHILVEEISKQLMKDSEYDMAITQQQFINCQRAASLGACAIAAILETREQDLTDDDLIKLITKVYTWYSAEQAVYHSPEVAMSPTNGKSELKAAYPKLPVGSGS